MKNHWCHDVWCYVRACDCTDTLAIETLMWAGVKVLEFLLPKQLSGVMVVAILVVVGAVVVQSYSLLI